MNFPNVFILLKIYPDPALLAELEKVKKEEEVFLDQYKQWKKQYDDWRDQNQSKRMKVT